MSHGHSIRMPAESPVAKALARASGTWGGYQAWRRLDPETRLELVEHALGCPSHEFTDCLPVAL